MARLGSWIEAHATGIHVPAGDFWIDPALSTERALITHGHSDHARGGHGHVLATPETLAIMRARYGEAGHATAISNGEKVWIGDVKIGREPGRERVCTCGEVSVVAGSL